MKLAIVSRYPPAECGIAEYTWFLVSSLVNASKASIIVIGNKDVPKEATEPRLSDVEVHRAFVSASNDYSGILEVIRSAKPDVVHVQHDYSFFPQDVEFLKFLEKCREVCRKVVVTMHTVKKPIGIARAVAGVTTFRDGAREDFELVLFQRKLVELSDVVVVHSYLQEFELWSQGADIDKVKIVPHGTLINPYCSKTRSELINELMELGIALENELIVFLPGFIRSDKGLDTALKVFDIVSRRFDIALVLGGAPQGRDSLELRDRLAKMASKRSKVVFLERFVDRDTMLKLFALSDIVILPYREVPGLIGVSGVLHLAMGSFKPLVCTRVPRLVEYCERVPELCARQGDVMEFAYKLMNLIENLEAYRKELEPVWKYALETSWDRIALKHLQLYETH